MTFEENKILVLDKLKILGANQFHPILVGEFDKILKEQLTTEEIILCLTSLRERDFINGDKINNDIFGNTNTKMFQTFYITIKGLEELDRIEMINQEKARLTSIENHQKEHRLWMTVLTAVLAGGTILAALYYLTQLCQYYHWTF